MQSCYVLSRWVDEFDRGCVMSAESMNLMAAVCWVSSPMILWLVSPIADILSWNTRYLNSNRRYFKLNLRLIILNSTGHWDIQLAGSIRKALQLYLSFYQSDTMLQGSSSILSLCFVSGKRWLDLVQNYSTVWLVRTCAKKSYVFF